MTVQAATARVALLCNGATTLFPVNIQAYNATDFLVLATNTTGATLAGIGAGASVVLTLNSDYTMAASGTLAPPFWALTSTVTYPTGINLLAILNPTETHLTQYPQGQTFPSLAVQTDFDRLTQMVIRLSDQMGRTIRQPDGDVTSWNALVSAAARANTLQGYDASGNPTIAPSLATVLTQAAFNALLNASPPYIQTPAELAAAVTPVNLTYLPGVLDRYATNTTPGTTDMVPAFQAALAQQQKPGGAPIQLGPAVYAIVSGTAIKKQNNSIPVVIQGIPNISCILNKAPAGNPTIQLIDQFTFDIRGIVFAGRATFPNTAIDLISATGGQRTGFGKIIDCVLNPNGIGIHYAGGNDLMINTCKYWPNGFGSFPGAATNDGANALPGALIADGQGLNTGNATNCSAAASTTITIAGAITGTIALGSVVTVLGSNAIPSGTYVTSIAGLPASFVVNRAVTIAGATVQAYYNPGQNNAVFVRDLQVGQCNNIAATPPGSAIFIEGSANAGGPVGTVTASQDWHIQDVDTGACQRSLYVRNVIASLYQNIYSGGEIRFDQASSTSTLQTLYGNTVVVDGTQILAGCERLTFQSCFASSITADAANSMSTHINNYWFTTEADASIPKRIIGGRVNGGNRTTDLIGGDGFSWGKVSPAIQALVNASAITTAGNTVIRVSSTANVTGIIVTKPVAPTATPAGCVVTIINTTAFTITMDVVANSFVADGVTCVIGALQNKTFTFEPNAATWSHS